MVKLFSYIESIVVIVVVESSYTTPKNVRRGSVRGCICSVCHIMSDWSIVDAAINSASSPISHFGTYNC